MSKHNTLVDREYIMSLNEKSRVWISRNGKRHDVVLRGILNETSESTFASL